MGVHPIVGKAREREREREIEHVYAIAYGGLDRRKYSLLFVSIRCMIRLFVII